MGVCYLMQSGGGASLNFKVVGGTSAPSSPNENTIWINTSTTITSYVFSATQPTGSDGMVWIKTGTSSDTEFNALKKNSIQICPLSAMQYVSSAWVDKTVKSYQKGVWVDWWNYELYKMGNEYEDLTGGWKESRLKSDYWGKGTVIKGSKSITLQTTSQTASAIITERTIDVTEYATLVINVLKCQLGGVNVSALLSLNSTNAYVSNELAYKTIETTGELSLDISSLSGKYYPGVALWGDGANGMLEFDIVRLDK